MKNMLHLDYAKIIVLGLCNSPNFITGHLKREINKLIHEGYEFDEVKHNLNFIISLVKRQIKEIYEKDLKKFNEYKELDTKLPNSKKYFYPQPKPVDEISIPVIHFPNRQKLNLSELTRTFTIKDFSEVEDALKEISSYFKERTIIETKTEQEQQKENDFFLSTIDDWLFEFKSKMSEADYQNLVSALVQYFDNGMFPTLSKPIQINGRLNKKLFGWALNRIFEVKGRGIEKELLQFAKQNISLFTDVEFDETNILKSNMYKYFTTQTK